MTREPRSAGGPTWQAVSARDAGVITLAGSAATLLGSAAPWLLKVLFGVSVATSGLRDVVPALVALTLISAFIASGVLFRHPAPSAVAIGLLALALAELCLAAWNSVSVLHAIALGDSRLVVGRAIGTGVYMGLLGASLTLAGGVRAWRSRAPSPAIVVNLE